jgi:small subunit ribosomal protein S20
MANIKSAAKRARQTEKRSLENRRVTSALKTQIKKFRADIAEGRKEEAKASAAAVASALDKAAKTNRIHRNSADRRKSAHAKALAALA